ncbi:Outer membrane translocation and assembly module TamA [Pseudomonas syringae pv. actinidiae]|uniref:Outer membrane translocation and assembly module TamA n=1 Tax=Pseudomonas syringae pv. actinidiae TaxID=103796 RepID=A0A2V0QTQ3_PSESF|nr:Outer membrane translocation and assembly module TamA [Pseudomonas syringae pv. actinidiae]
MGGRIIVESVAGCSWNGWPDDRGIRSRHEGFRLFSSGFPGRSLVLGSFGVFFGSLVHLVLSRFHLLLGFFLMSLSILCFLFGFAVAGSQTQSSDDEEGGGSKLEHGIFLRIANVWLRGRAGKISSMGWGVHGAFLPALLRQLYGLWWL